MGGDEGNEFDTPLKGDSKGVLADVTHVRNEERAKDFGAQWEMRDRDSPRVAKDEKALTQGQKKVLKTMEGNWGPEGAKGEGGKIRIAGNGMVSFFFLFFCSSLREERGREVEWMWMGLTGEQGGRSSAAQWSLYDEDPEASKKENAGIKSMGNGMGGRKGTGARGGGGGFDWDF